MFFLDCFVFKGSVCGDVLNVPSGTRANTTRHHPHHTAHNTTSTPTERHTTLYSLTISFLVFSFLFSLFSLLSSLFSLLCSLFSFLFSLCSFLFALFSVLCSLFSVLCSLFSVLCSLFSVLCSLFSVLCSFFFSLFFDFIFPFFFFFFFSLFLLSLSLSISLSLSLSLSRPKEIMVGCTCTHLTFHPSLRSQDLDKRNLHTSWKQWSVLWWCGCVVVVWCVVCAGMPTICSNCSIQLMRKEVESQTLRFSAKTSGCANVPVQSLWRVLACALLESFPRTCLPGDVFMEFSLFKLSRLCMFQLFSHAEFEHCIMERLLCPEVSLQLLHHSERRSVACGFFREENIEVLDARSILYAVRHAESSYPPGRFLIISENVAVVLAFFKGRSNTFTLLSVMRRIFASGFRAGFVLSFRSELNYSDKGSCFFNRDYDPSKSLLHVLAQRSTRSSPAQTVLFPH